MGDRTYVQLEVLNEHADQVCAIAEEANEAPESVEAHFSDARLTVLGFEEVNYGTLNFLPRLIAEGIAFESTWGHGNDYGPGTSYCRFTADGKLERFEVWEGGENPDIRELLERIDQPEELRQYILDHKKATTPLPWDHQIEYGQRYRARQLITPKEGA